VPCRKNILTYGTAKHVPYRAVPRWISISGQKYFEICKITDRKEGEYALKKKERLVGITVNTEMVQ